MLAALVLAPGLSQAELYYLIVSGIGGDPVYDERFASDAASMRSAAERTLGGTDRIRVLTGDDATRDALREALATLAETTEASDRLAVFLIGHGSYDGVEYKFNLKGEDIEGTELGELLAAVPAQSQLVVNTTSASGSLLESWTADGRALITATRSGAERNATRFAQHFASALSAEDADVDQNGSISAQEAFDYASSMVTDSYESDGALATEHPEIRGDTASAFEVARLRERVAVTPAVEALLDERDELLEEIAALRLEREALGDAYQGRMLELQIELAEVQERIDEANAE